MDNSFKYLNKEKLFQELQDRYCQTHPRSLKHFQTMSRFQVRGGSHNLRLFQPFPFYDVSASGSRVTDLDEFTYIDFWQGHFGNILGHNPRMVTQALAEAFQEGKGLSTGFPGIYQSELAKLILDRLGGGKLRFTTSGTLASMYAIMLAKSFTGKNFVLKIGGGWHGAQPYALKGISDFKDGLTQVESAGLPEELNATLLVSEFNDVDDLENKFKRFGDKISCLIMEPFIGAGGFIFGQDNYIQKARELTLKHGTVLIFDEVVSGFRFHAGPLQALYQIEADLTVFGKAIGGGMPLSALAGKSEIMELCSPDAPSHKRVKFEGGTFSAHPASILAGLRFLEYLIDHEKKIYPELGRLGQLAREGIEKIFAQQGFEVKCTGGGESFAVNSSVVGVHFLHKSMGRIVSPEQVWNPRLSDYDLRERIFKLEMLLKGFHIFHGYGTISYAHSEEEISRSLEAVEQIARNWRRYLD